MYNIHNAARATGRANSDNPRYYVNTEHGWQRYVPTGDEAPFVVKIRRKWHLVHRATSDAEFFAAHPEAAHRLTVRQLAPKFWAFGVRFAARDGNDVLADSFDFAAAMYCADDGSRGERWSATVRRLLRNQNLNIWM